MMLALGYGWRFGILTVADRTWSSNMEQMVQQHGLAARYAAARKLETPTAMVFTKGFEGPSWSSPTSWPARASAWRTAPTRSASAAPASGRSPARSACRGSTIRRCRSSSDLDGLKVAELRAELQRRMAYRRSARRGPGLSSKFSSQAASGSTPRLRLDLLTAPLLRLPGAVPARPSRRARRSEPSQPGVTGAIVGDRTPVVADRLFAGSSPTSPRNTNDFVAAGTASRSMPRPGRYQRVGPDHRAEDEVASRLGSMEGSASPAFCASSIRVPTEARARDGARASSCTVAASVAPMSL